MASKSTKRHCSCDQNNLHLHVEIENLKQRLLERECHIVKMETNFLKEAEKFPNGEFAALSEELLTWQDKYSRLFEAHKRVQKVNQGLEDKLLKMVDRGETEKNNLQENVAALTKKLTDQQTIISKLHEENKRCRNDLGVAIQLLQCKPPNFIPQKFDTLPLEFQAKVRSYVACKQEKFVDGANNNRRHDIKAIKVPILTFPPTAMVLLNTGKEQYNVDVTDSRIDLENTVSWYEKTSNDGNSPIDIVSAATIAKVLEEREREHSNKKHCQTCSCGIILHHSQSCQIDENVSVELNTTEKHHVTNVTLDNNLSLMDELVKEESINFNEDDLTVQRTNTINQKTTTQDLIDLNGDNSNDKYEYFRNLNPRTYLKGVEKNSINDKDFISFDLSRASENVCPEPKSCSVRLQLGSNNILLDNVAQFSSPVSYRRRVNMSELPEPEPTVHVSKVRQPFVSLLSPDYGER